jgi:ubiquinone/menaquinone biosynthesis C-methylase UbiE
MTLTPEEIQRRYYADTAASYDAVHNTIDGGHSWAINRLVDLIRDLEATSVLDVGTGTGRALKAIAQRCPDVRVHGVDPVPELISLAVERHGVPRNAISVGSGDALDFPDESFDIVCEFGVLHHVPDPAKVVTEMLRVARRGILISDSNRFGQGSTTERWIKLMLARMGLWQTAYRVIHKGKRYIISDGDGVAYSYSPYDNVRQIGAWADEAQILGAGPSKFGWLHPLLTSPHAVLIAQRHSRVSPAPEDAPGRH